MLWCEAGTGSQDSHSSVRGAPIQFSFTSLILALRTASRRGRDTHDPKEDAYMRVTRLLGLAAVGALLILAAPTERAQALSLASPGGAAAVQDDAKDITTP